MDTSKFKKGDMVVYVGAGSGHLATGIRGEVISADGDDEVLVDFGVSDFSGGFYVAPSDLIGLESTGQQNRAITPNSLAIELLGDSCTLTLITSEPLQGLLPSIPDILACLRE